MCILIGLVDSVITHSPSDKLDLKVTRLELTAIERRTHWALCSNDVAMHVALKPKLALVSAEAKLLLVCKKLLSQNSHRVPIERFSCSHDCGLTAEAGRLCLIYVGLAFPVKDLGVKVKG